MPSYPEIQSYIGSNSVVNGISGDTIVVDSIVNDRIVLIRQGTQASAGIRQFDVTTGLQTNAADLATIFNGIVVSPQIDLESPFSKTYDGFYVTAFALFMNGSAAFARIDPNTLQVVGSSGLAGSSSPPNYYPSNLSPASVGAYQYMAATSFTFATCDIMEMDASYCQFAGFRLTAAEGYTFSTATKAGTGVIYVIASAFPGAFATVVGVYKITIAAGAQGYNTASWPTANANISSSKSGTFHPADVDATYLHFDLVSQPGYDQSDGNLLMFVGDSSAVTKTYLIKVNATTGAVMWATAVTDAPNPLSKAFEGSNIQGGKFWYLGSGNQLYQINTSTGAIISQTNLVFVPGQMSIYDYPTSSVFGFGDWGGGAPPPTAIGGTTSFTQEWFRLVVGPLPGPPPVPSGPPFVCLMGPARAPGSPPPPAGVEIVTEGSDQPITTEGGIPLETEG